MSTTDDYDSSQESTLRPIDSTIMKSQWDYIGTDVGDKRSKHSRDWVDEDDTLEVTEPSSTIYSRTMYDENQHLSKVQDYVNSVSRRDKIRMDHEIKATSPIKVPNDKMGAFLYGCSSKEVMTADVDRGCMLSCLNGYRPEDVDSCNHDVYSLKDSVLVEVYKAPVKSKSEVAYIFTEANDVSLGILKSKLAKMKGVPASYKVFGTNSSGSTAVFLFEVIPTSEINSLVDNPQDATIVVPDDVIPEDGESYPPPPPTNYAIFWTWLLIIIVVILIIIGIIWLISYFMRQQQSKPISKTETVIVSTPVGVMTQDVVVTESTTIITTSESDLWGTPPSTGPRKPYSY